MPVVADQTIVTDWTLNLHAAGAIAVPSIDVKLVVEAQDDVWVLQAIRIGAATVTHVDAVVKSDLLARVLWEEAWEQLDHNAELRRRIALIAAPHKGTTKDKPPGAVLAA